MSFYRADSEAQRIGEELLSRALNEFASRGLVREKLALTLLIHHGSLTADALPPSGFGYRAGEPFYPCSVVKLFYLVAAQARLEEGFISPHSELGRAMRDMILYSSNTATNYVIDLVTDTTGDTLLSGPDLDDWTEKRN